MNTGQLSKSVEYPIKIFTADSMKNDYIRVRHRKSNVGNFSSSWSGMIRNLKKGGLEDCTQNNVALIFSDKHYKTKS